MRTITPTQGVEPQLNSSHHSIRPTFGIACWVLAMLAFVQLLTVGTALAVKREGSEIEARKKSFHTTSVEGPIQVRSIEQMIADAEGASRAQQVGAGISANGGGVPSLRPLPKALAGSLSIKTLSASTGGGLDLHRHLDQVPQGSGIANPRVERLVQEARNSHIEGDIMRAMLKLDEASRLDPTECAVIYQKGLLFEDMGSLTKAADQYQTIQQMGIVKAGAYFKLAASKLTKGMDTASSRRDTIAIGPIKINQGGAEYEPGRHVDVSITLLARPDQVILSDDVEVQVHFYDKVNGGDIKKAASNANIDPRWSDLPVDWQNVGNEETLRVSYTIPQVNEADEYLLGRRTFYGIVVELLYKGEVIDQQATPRRLNAIHAEESTPTYQDDPGMPWLPEDDNGLLPGKNHEDVHPDVLPTR